MRHQSAGGKLNQKVSVYYVGVPLQQGKTVKYISLPDISQGLPGISQGSPDISQGATQGQTAMHIFVIGFG